jgi:hypothetical protein
MDTDQMRTSLPLSIAVHVPEDDHLSSSINSHLQQTVYVANVSSTESGERAIAQVKAKEGDGAGTVQSVLLPLQGKSFYSTAHHQIPHCGGQ